MIDDAVYGKFLREAFSNGELFLALNANDLFGYACADSESIESDAELDEVVRIRLAEGWPGLVRWKECKRGMKSLEENRE